MRELTANPDLPDADLRSRLGRELFGEDWQPAQVDDLFFLFQMFNTDRDWSVPGALTMPGLVNPAFRSVVSWRVGRLGSS